MTTYPLFKVHIDKDAALTAIGDVIDSGFVNEGREVERFATGVADFLGEDEAVPLNSCTSAISLALLLAGAKPGTEVISTPMTCVATNTPVVHTGADLVWADVLPQTGMIDPADVARLITRRTRAVIAVDWAGVPCALEELDALCREAGVALIQDAAHGFGARLHGESVSRYADFTCYSFQAIKHLTCGDGGALIVRDPAQRRLAKRLKWFGYDRERAKDAAGNWRGQAEADILEGEVGFKYNMNNIDAAVGLAQLGHAEDILSGHRRNAAVYDEAFADLDWLHVPPRPEGAEPSFWVYTAVTEPGIDRDGLIAALNAEGIMAGQVHMPNDELSCFAGARRDLPGVRAFSSRQVSLPCGWWLDASDARYIAGLMRALGPGRRAAQA